MDIKKASYLDLEIALRTNKIKADEVLKKEIENEILLRKRIKEGEEQAAAKKARLKAVRLKAKQTRELAANERKEKRGIIFRKIGKVFNLIKIAFILLIVAYIAYCSFSEPVNYTSGTSFPVFGLEYDDYNVILETIGSEEFHAPVLAKFPNMTMAELNEKLGVKLVYVIRENERENYTNVKISFTVPYDQKNEPESQRMNKLYSELVLDFLKNKFSKQARMDGTYPRLFFPFENKQ